MDQTMERRVRESFERQAPMSAIGAILEDVTSERVVLHLPFHARLTQQNGFFHGGVIATTADVAGGYAAYSGLPPLKWLFRTSCGRYGSEIRSAFLILMRGIADVRGLVSAGLPYRRCAACVRYAHRAGASAQKPHPLS